MAKVLDGASCAQVCFISISGIPACLHHLQEGSPTAHLALTPPSLGPPAFCTPPEDPLAYTDTQDMSQCPEVGYGPMQSGEWGRPEPLPLRLVVGGCTVGVGVTNTCCGARCPRILPDCVTLGKLFIFASISSSVK